MSDPIQESKSVFPPEVEEGRTFAILSYALGFIGVPFFLVPLIMRNNEFSLYHAKQCLMLGLCGISVGIVGTILTPVFCIGVILFFAGLVLILVLDILGLVNAVKGEQKPLPVIGKYADDWFKGLKKV
jgi:uncharacterized membrane protein